MVWEGPPEYLLGVARQGRDGRVVEVFRSVEAKDAYETSDMADELRDEIIDLLAEPPVRIEAHPSASGFVDTTPAVPSAHWAPATPGVGAPRRAARARRAWGVMMSGALVWPGLGRPRRVNRCDSRWQRLVVNPFEADDTDAEVIARSHRRPELFAEVFDRHQHAVHAYAARRAGQDAADDVLSEVFLAAFGQRKRFDPEAASALPWLYGIARNILRRRWRSLATAERLLHSATFHAVVSADSHEDQVVDRVDSSEEWLAVRTVLDQLAEGDREAILLFAWEELTYPEIAAAMGIPVGTVRSRIHRARGRLRVALHDTLEVGR